MFYITTSGAARYRVKRAFGRAATYMLRRPNFAQSNLYIATWPMLHVMTYVVSSDSRPDRDPGTLGIVILG